MHRRGSFEAHKFDLLTEADSSAHSLGDHEYWMLPPPRLRTERTCVDFATHVLSASTYVGTPTAAKQEKLGGGDSVLPSSGPYSTIVGAGTRLRAKVRLQVVWYWTDRRLENWARGTLPKKLWGPSLKLGATAETPVYDTVPWKETQRQFILANSAAGRLQRVREYEGVVELDDDGAIDLVFSTDCHWSSLDESARGKLRKQEAYQLCQIHDESLLELADAPSSAAVQRASVVEGAECVKAAAASKGWVIYSLVEDSTALTSPKSTRKRRLSLSRRGSSASSADLSAAAAATLIDEQHRHHQQGSGSGSSSGSGNATTIQEATPPAAAGRRRRSSFSRSKSMGDLPTAPAAIYRPQRRTIQSGLKLESPPPSTASTTPTRLFGSGVGVEGDNEESSQAAAAVAADVTRQRSTRSASLRGSGRGLVRLCVTAFLS